MGNNQSVPVQSELEEAVLGYEVGGFPNIFGKHSELCMFAHVCTRYIRSYQYVPHKAVADVSKIGNL